MTMTIEKSLKDFKFWSGAATNAALLTDEELDELERQLEETLMGEEPWSTTEVNDWMWFDFEDICREWLGLDPEEVYARKKEE